MQQRPPYLSVALVSGAALAYEILLMRLFSIIQWHHFSYMVIALALLGYGFSGTFVSVLRPYLIIRFRRVYFASLLLFGLTSVLSFLLAQQVPFNAEVILWDHHQLLYLLVIFVLLSIPFFFAATAICLAFMQYNGQVSRIYAWDLAGAGIGSLAVMGLLFVLFPQNALFIIALLGLTALLVAGMELQVKRLGTMGTVVLAAILLLALMATRLDLHMSPYKALPQTLRIGGTEVIEQDSSPLGLISIVDSKQVPFRHAPGLSLASTQEPLPQLALFTDGDNMTVMTKAAGQASQLDYLDQVTSALPYYLSRPATVLIVGAGGGTDILQALHHGVADIDAVELNTQLIDIVGRRYSAFNGGLYQRPGVQVHAADVRGFLTSHPQQYDLIQLALMDAFNASTSGLYALNEDYLYTVEALSLYLDHLSPGGYLALTRWVKVPPRDTLKLFATAIESLKTKGVADPAAQLALIRGWQTSTLLVRNGVIGDEQVKDIISFSDARSFDVAYAPDLTPRQDSYNQLPEQWFRTGTAALLSDAHDSYLNDYKFDLEPATDDRPYFHHFTKWSSLPEIFHLRNQGAMSLIEWGYVVLVMTLAVAALLSVILIALPLRFLPRGTSDVPATTGKHRVFLYFLAIGIAFLFMEIAFMQKFILFLHHPLYSFAVTLTAFLVFAGLGSNLSAQWSQRVGRRVVLFRALAGIVLIGLAYVMLLDTLVAHLSSIAVIYKIIVTLLLVAPLALLMGMPFPLALSSLAGHAEAYIPWAWGINGCASVISASLATLLAIHFGFSTVIVIAVLLYAGVWFVFPGEARDVNA